MLFETPLEAIKRACRALPDSQQLSFPQESLGGFHPLIADPSGSLQKQKHGHHHPKLHTQQGHLQGIVRQKQDVMFEHELVQRSVSLQSSICGYMFFLPEQCPEHHLPFSMSLREDWKEWPSQSEAPRLVYATGITAIAAGQDPLGTYTNLQSPMVLCKHLQHPPSLMLRTAVAGLCLPVPACPL